MKRFVVVRAEGYMTSRPASSVFVYTKTIFALQNACWGMPQSPLICIFTMQAAHPDGTLFTR